MKAHKINVLTTLSTEDLAKTLQHDVTAGIHSMHHHHEPVWWFTVNGWFSSSQVQWFTVNMSVFEWFFKQEETTE